MVSEKLDMGVVKDLHALDLVQSEALDARFERLGEQASAYALRVQLGPSSEHFELLLSLKLLDDKRIRKTTLPMESAVETESVEHALRNQSMSI